MLRRRRLHRLRLAAISRRTVRNGRKQGRDWCVGMEEAGADFLLRATRLGRLSSCARGTTRCRDRDPSDRSARRRILAKPPGVRRIGETENAIGDIVPAHRVPQRTQRKPAAEFVDDVVVLAHDLIGEDRDLTRPFASTACSRNAKRRRLSEPLIAASFEAINDTLSLTVDQIRFARKPLDVEFLAKFDLDTAILRSTKFP